MERYRPERAFSPRDFYNLPLQRLQVHFRLLQSLEELFFPRSGRIICVRGLQETLFNAWSPERLISTICSDSARAGSIPWSGRPFGCRLSAVGAFAGAGDDLLPPCFGHFASRCLRLAFCGPFALVLFGRGHVGDLLPADQGTCLLPCFHGRRQSLPPFWREQEPGYPYRG